MRFNIVYLSDSYVRRCIYELIILKFDLYRPDN